jgi:hypothetical protein
MEHAAELLQSEEDFGRSGIRHAIHACHSFLHVRGLSGQALKPLMDLVLAFESRDQGILPGLFDPKFKRGIIGAEVVSIISCCRNQNTRGCLHGRSYGHWRRKGRGGNARCATDRQVASLFGRSHQSDHRSQLAG